MEVKETLDRILDLSGDLAETKKDLIILKFVEKSTAALSLTILGIIGIVVGSLILLFIGLGFAWWIGVNTGEIKIGFFIVGGVYLLLLFMFILLSKGSLFPAIQNYIIKKFYED